MTTQLPTIKPLDIHGKEYITVSDRVKLCHADEGFSMISQEHYSICDRHFFTVTIEVKGKHYTGDAEIPFTSKSALERDHAIEVAQTSALGRALGFANYGVIDAIASADEVIRAEAESAKTVKPRPQSIAPARPHALPEGHAMGSGVEELDEIVRQRMNELYARAHLLGVCANAQGFLKYAAQVLGNAEVSKTSITLADLERIDEDLRQRESTSSESAGAA